MRRAASIAVMLVFWLLVSGSLKPLDLLSGLVIGSAAGWWADRTLWSEERPPLTPRSWLRAPAYLLYLLKEIVVAAVYVAERVLDPALGIAPTMQIHRARFTSDTARVAFANSITLTPGTLTVDVDGDVFIIHCLHESFADAISSGDLERRVATTFDR